MICGCFLDCPDSGSGLLGRKRSAALLTNRKRLGKSLCAQPESANDCLIFRCKILIVPVY